MINISESEFPYLRAMPGETYRRIGVPGSRRLQSVIQLRRDLLIIIAVSKSSLASPDADPPTRRYVSPSLRQRLSVLPTDRLTSAATPACDLQTRLHRICLSFF